MTALLFSEASCIEADLKGQSLPAEYNHRSNLIETAMNHHQNPPDVSGSSNQARLDVPLGALSRIRVLLALLTAMVVSLAAPKAMAQTYTATNVWNGVAGDLYWSTPGNWVGSIVPDATSLVSLTNLDTTGFPGTNGSGAVGTPNIIVSNNTSVASLWIMNTNVSVANAGFHTILISNGVTLTISNNPVAGQFNALQVCSQSGAGAPSLIGADYGVNQRIYATIQGEGGTLVVIGTNGLGTTFARGNILVSQGSLGLSASPTIDPLNAILDLSGLDNLRIDANHILLGDGGAAPFFFNRPAGTIYFAKTNLITLWAVGNHPSAGSAANQGIMTGVLAQNNGGGFTRIGRYFLGQTNAVFCNSGVALAIRGCSGWLGFNPSNAPGISYAYFRDRAGTGRQNSWAIGNRLGASSTANQDVNGTMDFSGGTVDALVGTLGIGVNSLGNLMIGTVSFGAGTIDANVLQLGTQTASTGNSQGTLTVSNTAILKVNTSGALGSAAGSTATSFARLIITNGGTVQFANTAPITCGPGSTTEIHATDASSLSVFTVGTLAAPLSTLQLGGSTLTVDRGTASNPTTGGLLFVNNLDLSGVNTINMLGPVLVVGQFPIIKYTTLVNGGFANLTLGSTSPGVAGYLSNNVANSSIDFVVTSSTTTVLTWNGLTNAVNIGNWDIGVTPDWQGALTYSQASVPGSLVRFDDTAAGTTTVTLTTSGLAPATLIVSNNSKNYTFNGTGSLSGPTALTKFGTGTLTLGNTGTNTFSGGVFLNDGTLQNGGTGNSLPTSTAVIIQDVATAALNLNNLNLAVGSISGAGTTGGNIALGIGTLTLNSGSATYGGVISGSGAVIKTGSGTETLTGANNYSGGTFITNSGIVVLSPSGLGSGPVVIGTGGVLQLGDGALDGSVSAPYITNFGTLNLKPASSTTLTNLVIGTGGLVKLLGSGTTLYITNANPYTGNSAVQEGVLQISDARALGTGAITIGNAIPTTQLAVSGNINYTNAITLAGKTGAVVPSPVGLNNVTDVNSGLPGTNTVSGPISISGSTCWSVGSDAGLLIVNGTFANNSSAGLGQFFLRGAGDGIWASALKDNSASFRLALNKNDPGRWTLTGTNTYTGLTVINEGTLVVNGALTGTSNLTVFDGTLSGTGYINGAVTNSAALDLSGDGVLAPLTISNVLFLDSVATTAFDVSTNGNDSIRGLTTVIYNGLLRVVLNGPLTGNAVFKLFYATNYAGNFGSFDLPDITPLTWDTSHLTQDGTLHAVGGPVVNPRIISFNYGGPGGFSLSGTGTVVAPYNILASTNVALPVVSWQNIGSGTFSNGSFQFNDTSATNFPRRFYLLSTPAP